MFGEHPRRTAVRVLVLAAVSFITFKWLLIPIRTEGSSMLPTYSPDRFNLVNRLAYVGASPSRGDVIAIRMAGPHVLYVKRVIGMPGERVSVDDGLVSINGVSLGMLLGTLCARFRDIPPIVTTVMQMMFLLTPILWRPHQMEGREFLYLFNPFFYLVEIIREPLQGVSPSLFTWGVAVALTAVGFVVSLLFFSRFRNRIVYWL